MTTHPHHRPGRYEIRVKGHLPPRWTVWFDGLALTRETGGTTLIHGHVADQAALHGVLQKVRDTGLPLVSVNRVDTDHLAVPIDPHQPTARKEPT
jgi:hypothetical protein